MNYELVRLGPKPNEAAAAVILLHGRGSSGSDIARLADEIPVPGVHWVAPTATGNTWYPRRFLEPLDANEPWLSAGLELIGHLVKELERAGLASDRIGLSGFSQGACLALEYAIRHPRRYAFVAALSGALIGPLGTARRESNLEGTPLLLACADEDGHIPKDFVDQSEQELLKAKAAVTRFRFPGATHAIFKEELDWISKALMSAKEPGGEPK